MALVKCKDCGKKISKNAKTCPECGSPLKRNKIGCSVLILFIIIAAAASSILSFFNKDGKRPLQTVPAVKTQQAKTTSNITDEEKQAIQFCNMEIRQHFDSSVNIQFPTPIISKNNNAYFVHYKNDKKLSTGDSTKVDARCTVWKGTYEVTGLTIAGKTKK